VERLMRDAENLRRSGLDFSNQLEGQLTVAATHSQARYALPHVVKDFRERYPAVTLHLHQGSPKQVAAMLMSGEADIGVATEALADYAQLITLPCYHWTHSILVPLGHPLEATQGPIGLEQIAQYPLITYEKGYTGRSHIDDAFLAAGLQPNVVLTAMDADVIKTYVELGMGVGIVASIALDTERDLSLRVFDAGHLFAVNVTRLGLRKGTWLRGFAYSFVELFVPTLTRDVVDTALKQPD
jgi:LysR family cys regulon transcriptional activator